MKKMFIFSILLVMCSHHLTANHKNLIPLAILFGNQTKTGITISPDEKKISFLASYKGVLNIWIGDIDDEGIITNEQIITKDSHRGITNYFWSYDSKKILYLQDKNGDENWLLYGLDLTTNTLTTYTPFNDVQVRIAAYTKKYPDTVLLYINKEDQRYHDLYKLNVNTAELTLFEKNNDAFQQFIIDHDLTVRGAIKPLSNCYEQLLLKQNNQYVVKKTWSDEDSLTSNFLSFSSDPNIIYLINSQNSNTGQLVSYNLITDEEKILFKDIHYDVTNITQDATTHELVHTAMAREKNEKEFFSSEYKKLIEEFFSINAGYVNIDSYDNTKKKIILSFEQDNAPVAYYFYNKETKKHRFLGENRPELKEYKLACMEPIQFTSRDGLTIHGYLTIPHGATRHNLPLVINVHGGPSVRDYWGFNTEVQWLANRGYAVLQLNFRGSKGYGKHFLNAGYREWGAKMHDDLIDGIKWAVTEDIANPKKIAIYGGSYGGYAALVGATFTPDVFCCAVDIVGPSNLLTLAHSIPSYWETGKKQLYKKIGNPDTEPEFLKSRSPLFKADCIKIPLLIAHGANDPRVKQAESEQIVAALQKHNIPHEYLLFHDEGHGFVKPENRLFFYSAAEKFLATHLGGRYET